MANGAESPTPAAAKVQELETILKGIYGSATKEDKETEQAGTTQTAAAEAREPQGPEVGKDKGDAPPPKRQRPLVEEQTEKAPTEQVTIDKGTLLARIKAVQDLKQASGSHRTHQAEDSSRTGTPDQSEDGVHMEEEESN